MPHAVRIIGALVAIGLLGYAMMMLSTGSRESASERKRSKITEARPEPDAEPRKPKRVQDDDAPAAPREPAPSEAATPRPVPVRPDAPGAEPIPYREARRDLERLVDDVERMAERGEHLPQPEWVELYRRGDGLIVSAMQAPAGTSQLERDEVAALNQRFRKSVVKIQPTGPNPTAQTHD